MKNIILETTRGVDAAKWASRYLRERAKQLKDKPYKGAVVFDIDGTIIREDRGDREVVIRAMQKIYKRALKLDMDIFFITARGRYRNVEQDTQSGKSLSNYEATERELARNGFDKYKKLYLMPVKERSAENYSRYKFMRRKEIVKKYREPIVLNVGNDWTDMMLLPPYRRDEPVFDGTPFTELSDKRYYVLALRPHFDFALRSIKLPNRLG